MSQNRIQILNNIIGVQDDVVFKSIDDLLVMKGRKPAGVGEKREWASGTMIKTPEGWKPFKEGDDEKYTEEEQSPDTEQTSENDQMLDEYSDEIDAMIDAGMSPEEIADKLEGVTNEDTDDEEVGLMIEGLIDGGYDEEELAKMTPEEISDLYDDYSEMADDSMEYEDEDESEEIKNMRDDLENAGIDTSMMNEEKLAYAHGEEFGSEVTDENMDDEERAIRNTNKANKLEGKMFDAGYDTSKQTEEDIEGIYEDFKLVQKKRPSDDDIDYMSDTLDMIGEDVKGKDSKEIHQMFIDEFNNNYKK